MADNKKRPGKDLDRIDRNILNELQKDGRISNVELSKRVGLSPTPCLERVRRLERRVSFMAIPHCLTRIIWMRPCWFSWRSR